MKKLNLNSCKTNKEVCELVSERAQELTLEELNEKVNERFIFQEKATKAIYSGLVMSMNVFLSGLGGFGKSELIKYILDIYKIPYTVIVGYKDMPVDALLGIPNMDKLLKDSIYEINFKDSVFYEKKVLIAEEFTDILPSTAAALKDVLTEKGYRYKGTKIESFVPIMIIAANKPAKDMVHDSSTAALYEERFPLQVEVGWESYEVLDYYYFLKLVFKEAEKKELYFLAKLFEYNFTACNIIVSPRIAKEVTKTFLMQGMEFINSFKIDTSYIDKVKIEADKEHEFIKTEDYFKVIKGDILEMEKKLDDKDLLNYYYIIKNKLENLKIAGDNINTISEIFKHIDTNIDILSSKTSYFKDINKLITHINK